MGFELMEDFMGGALSKLALGKALENTLCQGLASHGHALGLNPYLMLK